MSASPEASRKTGSGTSAMLLLALGALLQLASSSASFDNHFNSHQTNGFPVFPKNDLLSAGSGASPAGPMTNDMDSGPSLYESAPSMGADCPTGLLTFELSTGFIYKPTAAETLAMMPSTLQLTDCLDYCLHNATCLAINFEMGLCVLLSSSAKQNPSNLYSSQFPVFTIYAEKKCLLSAEPQVAKRRRCQRAWTFERVAGYEMKTPPRRRLKLASKEQCMEACLAELEFECRSANWHRQTGDCSLSEQDRHSVSQSEAGDQHIKASLLDLYGPSSQTAPVRHTRPPSMPAGLYQNYYERANGRNLSLEDAPARGGRSLASRFRELRQLAAERLLAGAGPQASGRADWASVGQYVLDMPANALVDYLENNCVYEPNKLCEFRKIQNRVLKTVDSIYQDVKSLDECKQKCLNAPYRCYSFDYGDTMEHVCRTSHLDQASLLSVREPYLDVAGAITYELASCFNVSVQCRAKEMVAQVSSSKSFRGKIYVKSRPSSCVNDVKEALHFELSMRYHDEGCDVRASSNAQQGVFSNEIIIQHHDRIVTTQDVGLSIYCQYDLGNKSITNNVDLAIERIEDVPLESKTQPGQSQTGSINSPLTITSLATTVVRSPNVTMRITNMGGHPVTSATVGDRLGLLFEIKEKTSPFGIFVREIIAMDGRQVLATSGIAGKLGAGGSRPYHYANASESSLAESLAIQAATPANSIQFIDAHGCPTDANIMGPLVKLDNSGQRVLAPFDAFKFPTSDVVFFRAVVSSCVAECQPVHCSSPAEGPTEVGYTPTTMSPALHGSSPAGYPTTLTDLSLLQGPSSRQTAPPRLPEGTRTSTMPPELAPTTPWGTTLAAQEAAANGASVGAINRTRPHSNGDSLTTVPGFSEAPDVWTIPDNSVMTGASEHKASHQQVNMTNNHQFGKPPPRPSAPPQGQPLQFDKLSNLEKHQLVQLFESRLKEPASATEAQAGQANGNLSKMAEFYTGFLTSVLLHNNNSYIRNGAADATLTNVDNNLADYKRNEKVAQLLNANDFLAADAATQQQRQAQSAESLIELQNLLSPYLLANRTEDIREMIRTLLERRTKVDSIERQQKQKQPVDSLNDIAPVQLAKSRSQQPQVSGNRTQHPQQRRSAQEVAATAAGKRKRDKASHLQAFADSYLGAHQQSSGRRRRRRQADEDSLLDSVAFSATLAPPGAGEAHFTRATVHMYHRQKREAEPRYELDEMVVQSIKIVDRLQFPEDGAQTPPPRAPAQRRRSPTRAARPRELGTAGLNPQAPLALGEPRTARAMLTWSSSGVLSLILVALSFLFAQVFLVALCLLDWRRRRRSRPLVGVRPILGGSLSGSLDTLRSSGSSGYSLDSCASSRPPESLRGGPLPQYLLGEAASDRARPGAGRRASRLPGRAEMRAGRRYPAETGGLHLPVAYNCQTHAHNHEPPSKPPSPPPVDLKQTDQLR